MSAVKGADTELETSFRRAVWSAGLRYRIRSKLPGKPDLVFTRHRTAVFIDGCFWHGCPVHCKLPETNAEFWRTKMNGNITRDREVNSKLAELGWTVIRFWQHEIKEDRARCLDRLFQSFCQTGKDA